MNQPSVTARPGELDLKTLKSPRVTPHLVISPTLRQTKVRVGGLLHHLPQTLGKWDCLVSRC